jgi:rubredoxin
LQIASGCGESIPSDTLIPISYSEKGEIMAKWVCQICGYVYDPAVGDEDRGIPPGTPFEKLPDDWTCPICGASKDDFEKES